LLLLHLIEGQPIPLQRCIPFAKILQNTLSQIVDTLKTDPGNVLSADDHQKIVYAVNAFEQKIAHEFETLEVFYIPPKGTHSTLKLIEHAEENLSADIRSRLSAETIEDLRQAGRCLALEASTAAAFHLFRAIETLIRAYHFKITGSVLTVRSRNWGAYIRDLNSAGADTRITGFLQHIKDHYRNPIMHPEVTVSPDEALALFGAALSAITQLDAAIK
jgi:hypothetical protein